MFSLSPYTFIRVFKEILLAFKAIIDVSLSSGMSCDYNFSKLYSLRVISEIIGYTCIATLYNF